MSLQARLLAVEIKRALLNCYSSNQSLGFETAQRALWEIGDMIADMHGRKKAAEAVYRIADEIVAGEYADILALPEQSIAQVEPAVSRHPNDVKLSLIGKVRALIRENPLLRIYEAVVIGILIGMTIGGSL